jgi:hypothetical protein
MALQIYLEHIDELAYVILNTGADLFPVLLARESSVLFDKASRYLATKRIADNGRKRGTLSEREVADESATRQSLAEACNAFDDIYTSRYFEEYCRSRFPSHGGS